MKCPLCNTEAFIQASRHVIEGDNDSETETKLFIEQDLVCRNKNCSNHGEIVKTIRHPLKIG